MGLPNGQQLKPTNVACELNLPQVPAQGRQAHLLPGLTHSSLVYIGQLCDAGFQATFDQTYVNITNNGDTIITGHRDFTTGLWRIPLTMREATTPQQINSAYQTNSLPALVALLRAAAFIPSPSTWLNAINNGFFLSWPGLATEVFSYYLPK